MNNRFGAVLTALIVSGVLTYCNLFAQENENQNVTEVKTAYKKSIVDETYCIKEGDPRGCNVDFDACSEFIDLRDLYLVQAISKNMLGTVLPSLNADAVASIQARASTIIQSAHDQGNDINIAAFDTVSGDAKESLVKFKASLVAHMALAAQLVHIAHKWPDTGNIYEDVKKYKYNRGVCDVSDLSGKNDSLCFSQESDEVGCKALPHFVEIKNDGPEDTDDLIRLKKFEQTARCDSDDSKQGDSIIKKYFNQVLPQRTRATCRTTFSEKNTKVSVTVCRHLCDVEQNRYKFVIPNGSAKQVLTQFMGQIKNKIDELTQKINAMNALQDKIAQERANYLDSMNKNNNGGPAPTATNGPSGPAISCENNPFMAGCVYNSNKATNGGSSGGNSGNSNTSGNNSGGNDPTVSDVGKIGNDNKNSSRPVTGAAGSAGAGDGGGGVSGGGGGDGGVASTGSGEEEKEKKPEGPIDISGVDDYGSKKKRTSSGMGSSSDFNKGTKEKKVKNPFEDLFGDKKSDKALGGVHLRDIASSNSAEDEANGYSNIFSRISKIYTQKYFQRKIGDKN